MARLKAALIREYEDNDEVHIEVHNPRNTEAVTLNFRGEKLAKVMGFLADKKPEQGQRVSGILVKRNFNYHILSPCDLSSKCTVPCQMQLDFSMERKFPSGHVSDNSQIRKWK